MHRHTSATHGLTQSIKFAYVHRHSNEETYAFNPHWQRRVNPDADALSTVHIQSISISISIYGFAWVMVEVVCGWYWRSKIVSDADKILVSYLRNHAFVYYIRSFLGESLILPNVGLRRQKENWLNKMKLEKYKIAKYP